MFFVTTFFSIFFFLFNFHIKILWTFLPLHLGQKKTWKEKYNAKKKKSRRWHTLPFKIWNIHSEILLGLSCFANLNWIVIVKLFLSFWSNLLHISPNVKRQNCYYLNANDSKKKSRTLYFWQKFIKNVISYKLHLRVKKPLCLN